MSYFLPNKPQGRLIIVAYRLPFKIEEKNGQTKMVQNSGGLVSAVLSLTKGPNSTLFAPHQKCQWIGFGDSEFSAADQRDLQTEDFVAHPVFLDKQIQENYYEGFCNNLLWPLCHYFPSLARFEDRYYQAYHVANEAIFSRLVQVIRPGDVVWVHDYQLMLLPAMVRARFPEQKIGFFFHIPFPSFEVFRLLPVSWRKSLIDGVLGADLIGFHTNDYAEYFLKTAWLVSGYNNKLHYIHIENRVAKADAFPISIDFEKFAGAYSDPEIGLARLEIKKALPFKIIFSVDRLDYSKGIIHRLRGFRQFLHNCPEWHGRISLVMVVVPSRDTIEQYQQMKSEIDQTVGTINADFGSINWQPVIYQYRSMTFTELSAMYTASDVALVTPVRDGMNLVCKEYVASRADGKGVLILSEMAGAAAELGEALIINPLDAQDTAEAIRTALVMPEPEQAKRMQLMRDRIRDYDVFTWTADFFAQMNMLDMEQNRLRQTYLNDSSTKLIRSAYESSSRRILFFDYDGTLAPIVPDPASAFMPEEIKTLIRRISERDTTVIVSGRDRGFLDRQFHGFKIGMIAEHGALVKDLDQQQWRLNENCDMDWKQSVLPILQTYVQRCPGAFVEDKETSLAWHYRNVEDELYATRRAQELLWQLKIYLQPDLNLQILDGNKVLEIKKTDFNKGTSARAFLESGPYDFILAIGDDVTDEDLFRAMPESAFTIKVGDDMSLARYHIKNQGGVSQLLAVLARGNDQLN
ncbi:bifunctional alpha,alpha-trehalose-phosphate synthase (UDP-forming)/trehalose-phosphatase [Dyadobacter fermentans]|uniref:bifunctional alpha,alpha-trehalose-phosphate synthase (UDP-forming)/trehalose-phosphatase n=1 Tax=Dyadobacter fermentans TaxID=94254 RepID=UPI001CBD6C44|nr:bifunctional alpha,alpha-trehalose-phosphate synthase (UDP-forming)/trehalose-phosphatase [Dyadobacter fermentans]MBZ1362733.1 bifunctional alpha,alpha-trehalose-phosphate synthase (UDP-forming)/trehalose-phosphatase [Dyadobacter fermentans]